MTSLDDSVTQTPHGTRTEAVRPSTKVGTVHEIGVRIILRRHPEAKRKGFAKACVAALLQEVDSWADEYERELRGIVPDAFSIDEKDKEVTIYEVEDSHPITFAKLTILARLGFFFDCEGWEFNIVVCNRYAAEHRLDWYEIYTELVKLDLEKRR